MAVYKGTTRVAGGGGIPSGGTIGQVLSKNSNTSGDVEWSQTLITVDTPPESPSTYDDEFSDASIDAKWEDFNLASGTKSEDSFTKCMILGAAGTGLSQQGIVQASPTGNFTVTCKLGGTTLTTASFRYGIVVAETKTGKNFTFTHIAQNTPTGYVLYEVMNTPTTRATYNLVAGTTDMQTSSYLKMYVYNDGGTWKANTYFSKNGIVYTLIHSAIAIGFTPAYVGLVVNSEGVAGTNTGYFEYFRVV